MLIVVPYHPGDAAQALAQARWIAELDAGLPNEHDLILIADTRCSAEVTEQIRAEYAKSFATVTVMPFVDHYCKWAESPNAVFSQAARHITENQKQPWLLLEPDAVPLSRGFRDAIWTEYQQALKARKYFLGDLVTVNSPHCSGVAVYPHEVYERYGNALLANEEAWDMVAATQILPQMMTSQLIRHVWNAPAFANWEDVQERIFSVKPKAVLFHADKAGSLYPLLRQKLFNLPVVASPETGGSARMLVQVETPSETRDEAGKRRENSVPRGGQFICDLLLKTFPPDAPFAEYCVRSIDKFCTGFRQLIIVAPDDKCPRPTRIPSHVFTEPEATNGYNGQQLVKMNADQYSDATHFLFCDSDTIFTKPVTPETYMRDGKPLWLMTPFEKAREDQKRAWIPVMTKWMGKAPEFEFMRRHFFMWPRWLCEEMRKFCLEKHGKSLEDYVLNAGDGLSYSEFNCGGFLAYEKFRDRFAWVNTETDQVPELTALQHWSRGGLTSEIVAEFEQILGMGSSMAEQSRTQVAGSSPAPCTTSSTAVSTIIQSQPDQIPWANRDESIAEINRLAARLKEFQGDNAAKVRFVRELLQRQGVIELTYRNKRRKGWKRKKK